MQKQEKPISNFVEKRRRESVIALSLLGLLGSCITIATTIIVYLFSGSSQPSATPYMALLFSSTLMAICLTSTFFLVRRKNIDAAIWLFIFSTEIFFITISFMIANLGIILAVILFITIGNLTLQTLSSKKATVAITTSIVTSITTWLVDALSLNPLHIIPEDGIIKTAIIIAGIIILILGMELISYYQFNKIRSQIITVFILISVIPLWTITIPQLIENRSSTEISITILIATILMLAALSIAIIASNKFTSPINYLITTLKQVKQDELNFSMTIERRDELGQLSKALNATTLELQEILATLENKVDERTAYLANATKNIEQGADQLRSVVEVALAITSIQNLNELLIEITRQVSIAFNFYHVGIFLTDQTGHHTTLQATNSPGGKKMMEKGYRVKIDQTNNIGFVTSTGKIHAIVDVEHESTIFNNSDLPDTHSEIILPLQIGENIIGVLDLQSDKNTDFSVDSIHIFSMLAKQISIAIKNAQLFEKINSALAEAQVFYKQSATASWRDVLHQGTRGYRYLNGATEPINDSEKVTGQTREKKNTTNSTEALVIPINIRGKSLGNLNIHQTGRKHAWSNTEIRVYQSIVDRIAFALENARLYEDAQRRAAKERVISEISTKVSSSVNMDNILQTAVEELGRVLPGSEIVIQLEHEDETDTEFRAQE